MTPSNPNNGNPFILRIMDALGVLHQVAPVNHTHAQSEVDGLPAELADKADATATQEALNGKANLVHTHTQSEIDGLQSALLNKADAGTTDIKLNEKIDKVPSATSGDIAVFDIDGAVEDSGTKVGDLQPKLTFDSTPTANSTNPVTSGGIRQAIYNAVRPVEYAVPEVVSLASGESINLDEQLSMTPQSLRRIIIANETGGVLPVADTIYAEDLPVHMGVGNDVTIAVGGYALVTVYRINSSAHTHLNCYFVVCDATFDD
jgi:hypothetical protein